MRHRISHLVRGAALIALTPTCGGNTSATDAGPDVQQFDATATDVDTSDVDGGDVDDADAGLFVIPDIGPPPGCFPEGKPDHFAPCGYTELLNDVDACLVDPQADGGTQDSNLCYQLCSWDEPDCYYYELPEAGYYLTCGKGCIGRLHDAARNDAASTCAPLHATAGDVLADAARLEAASVDAFEIVARELEAFGAPVNLVSAARGAARQERRHARVVAKLAISRGVTPRAPSARASRARDLRSFAIENAVEGCVRETYGAALATFQAARARAADVREAMRSIALDEASHAELSFAIEDWLMTVIDDDTRSEIARVRSNAIAALELQVAAASRRPFDDEIGAPTREEAMTMLQQLRKVAWSPSADLSS